MCEKIDNRIRYRFVMTPSMSPMGSENVAKSINALKMLEGFSLVKSEEKYDFRYREKGKVKCLIQISEEGFLVSTMTEEEVKKGQWQKWYQEIASVLGAKLEWTGQNLNIMAVIHEYRIPHQTGNNYNFLRDALLIESNYFKIIEGMERLVNIELKAQGSLDDADLLIKITSNQTRAEILQDGLDDEDNNLIFEFHAIKTDIRCKDSLEKLAVDLEMILDEWLKKNRVIEKLAEIVKK